MNQEKMLATLATLLQVYVQSEKKRIPELERDLKDGVIIAIRAAIEEEKPKVSQEFVEKWADQLHSHIRYYRDESFAANKRVIVKMLREAGVRLKEER